MDKTALIGIGSAACKILSRDESGLDRIYIDTDKDVINKYSGIFIGVNICGDTSTGGNVNLGTLAMRESRQIIKAAIEQYESLLIIAPLGGGTSCGATRAFVEFILDFYPQKRLKILTSLPFDFEGGNRMSKAIKTLTYLEELCEVTNVGKLDYHKHFTHRPTLNEIFDLQDEQYFRLIKEFNND